MVIPGHWYPLSLILTIDFYNWYMYSFTNMKQIQKEEATCSEYQDNSDITPGLSDYILGFPQSPYRVYSLFNNYLLTVSPFQALACIWGCKDDYTVLAHREITLQQRRYT